MTDWSVIIAQLEAHANAHDLIGRTEQGFLACFLNQGGAIDGWTAADLRTEFRSHELAFLHATNDPYIETTLRLFAVNEPLIQVGYYSLITSLDGKDQDDYLVFNSAKRA